MSDENFQADATSSRPTGITEGHPPPAPAETESEPTLLLRTIRTREPTAMQLFFAWELLRLLFNLTVLVALHATQKLAEVVREFEELFVLAIVVNIFVCFGPIIENYLCWLGIPRSASRWIACVAVVVLFFLMTLGTNVNT